MVMTRILRAFIGLLSCLVTEGAEHQNFGEFIASGLDLKADRDNNTSGAMMVHNVCLGLHARKVCVSPLAPSPPNPPF